MYDLGNMQQPDKSGRDWGSLLWDCVPELINREEHGKVSLRPTLCTLKQGLVMGLLDLIYLETIIATGLDSKLKVSDGGRSRIRIARRQHRKK